MQSNSKIYINLAELLKQERSPEKSREVEEIVGSDLPISEKVRQIQRIDMRQDSRDYLSIDRLSPSDQDEKRLLEEENIVDPVKAENNRKKIKTSLRRNDLLSFLFSDFRRIHRFSQHSGRKNDLLIFSYVPPRVRINRRMQVIFEHSFQKIARELTPVLAMVLDAAWLHLDKFHYNLLEKFDRLCREILRMNLRGVDLSKDDAIDRISALENLYYTCSYQRGYHDAIAASVVSVVELHPEWNFQPTRVSAQVRMILDPTVLKPSLKNVLLAMNMVKSRRYLQQDDLVVQRGEIISTYDFECDEDTRLSIKSYIAKKTEELKDLMRQKYEMERYASYLRFDEEGNFDFSSLEYYYDHLSGADRSFGKDQEEPALLLYTFAEFYLHWFEEMLTGSVKVDEVGTVRLFEYDLFHVELNKLRSNLEKLDRYKFMFNRLSLERYHALTDSRKQGTSSEVELIQVLSGITSQIRSITRRLVDVDRFHLSGSSLSSTPVDTTMILQKVLEIPYADRRCLEPEPIGQRTVRQLMADCIMLGMSLLVHLRDRETMSLLVGRDKLYASIGTVKDILKRVATVPEFHRIMKNVDPGL